MAETIEFDLVAPEALILSEPVAMVVIPGGDGDFGVLPRHAPLISTIRPGVITVYQGQGSARQPSERIFIAGGFAEVTPERVTVLAEEAVKIGEIDRAKAEQAVKDARDDLLDAKETFEKTEAQRRLAIAEARVQAISH